MALAGCGGQTCPPTQGVEPCPAPPTYESVLDVAVADFNGDGGPDVATPVSVFGLEPGAIGVYRHGAAAGKDFMARVDYPVSTDPYTLLAVDLDGDGLPDAVTTDYRYSLVSVAMNRGDAAGTLGPAERLTAPDAAGAAVADLDGDGRLDLVIAGRDVYVSLQSPVAPGTFGTATLLYASPAGSKIRAVATGDLDGDGTADIVVADDAGVTVLFMAPPAGAPAIASARSVYVNQVPGRFTAIAIADIDGDGRNDLLIADSAGGIVAVLRQDPAAPGQFRPAQMYALPAGAGLSIVAADVDGDGRLDVVSGGSARVAVFRQDPVHPGILLPPEAYDVPIGANRVAVADIDQDGLPDIVTTGGVSWHAVGPVLRTPPGVLYQDAAHPGRFLPLVDLL